MNEHGAAPIAKPEARTLSLALVLAALALFVPLGRAGLWDPFELRSIELARRIAVGLFGAAGLQLAGAENALPTRGEVDRGELPFTSMALGMRLFGLHVWAARLPLALFGLLGLAATYVVVRRLSDRRAAVASVLVLATMPLYYLHARTLLGDIVTMAGTALATAGLALALFDAKRLRGRAAWLVVGGVGLVVGLLSRGVLLGVAVPVLGVALSWAVLALARTAPRDRAADVLGGVLLALGVASALLGVRLLAHALDDPARYFVWLGFGINRATSPPTFDAVVGVLGHALFPWSALVPVALARLTSVPDGFTGAARERECALRLTLVLTAALGLAAFGGVAPVAGVLPFGPVACLAALVGLALRDIDGGAPASRVAGMTAAALVVLLLADFVNLPDKLLAAYGVEGAHFPESFRALGQPWLFVAAALAALGFFAATLESEGTARPAFERRDYAAWLGVLREQWNGNLLFGACVVEAALLGFVAFDLLGERIPALARFAVAGDSARPLLRAAWLVVPLLLALPLLTLALRDSVRFLAAAHTRRGWRRLLPTRGALAASGGVLGGALVSLGFYPLLAAQLSPQGSFDAFHRLAAPGEALAVLGTSSAAAPYTAGRPVTALSNTEQASKWLLEPGSRRWLVLKADALAGLNSRYRARAAKPANLPILDGRSSEILLASNRLLPGETSQNPLDRYVLSREPTPSHLLDANLGDQLDVLGWDVTDLDGTPVSSISPGRRFEFVIYFRVVARIAGTWETFIHIDGFQRRFNADHPTLEGHYPFALWNVGDLIADRHEFALEPNFTRGAYHVYFGLYSGSRRLNVTRGTATEDRLAAGDLHVD
jgi:4-amino-4-deoxy-L-arabinose transferase-like glycosyltransferase